MTGQFIGHVIKSPTYYTVKRTVRSTISGSYYTDTSIVNINTGTYTMKELLDLLNTNGYVKFKQPNTNSFVEVEYARSFYEGVAAAITYVSFSTPVYPASNNNLNTDINELLGFPQGWAIIPGPTRTNSVLSIRSLGSVNTSLNLDNVSAAITIHEFGTNHTSTSNKAYTFAVPLQVLPGSGTFDFMENSDFHQEASINNFTGDSLNIEIFDIKTGTLLPGIGESQMVIELETDTIR